MTTKQRQSLRITLIISLLFGAYFLRDFFILLTSAAILAFLFNPLYKLLLRKTGKQGLSVTATVIAAMFALIIPLTLVIAVTVDQAIQIVDLVRQTTNSSTSINQSIHTFVDSLNQTIDRVPGQGPNTLNVDQITDWVKGTIPGVISAIVNFFKGFAGGIAGFFTSAIIFLFVFSSLLRNQDSLLSTLRAIHPLGKDNADLYLGRIGDMTSAMVKGQFAIAISQGIVSALLLRIVGLDYFFFWLVLLVFLSIIPLGAGIVVIPIAIVMLFTGNIWQGIVLLVGHFMIVTNIDNVLRPKFVPKTARLDSALTILAVFAGISMFGFLGIIVGPVIMIAIVTTIQTYLLEARSHEETATKTKAAT